MGMFAMGIALPGLTSTFLAGDDLVAGIQALRRQDVGELAVLIFDERDESRAVRVVFQPLDGGGHIEFLPLEIDDPVGTLVTAAAPPGGDMPVHVPASTLGAALGQRLHRLALP